MSNLSIVTRLTVLADGYEAGEIPLSAVARDLLGHVEALERLEYRQVKDAQLVQAQLLQGLEERREHDVDRTAFVGWLREWIRRVPVDAA
jgi:hypothetical protein